MIVAESLRRVPEPVILARPGRLADGPAVASTIARCLQPRVADDPPPPWLRGGQEASFRQALAAIRRFGGAMVAEPVGTGKTFIALAVAAALGGEAHCVVPAALGPQWLRAARRTGCDLELTTQEQWSRAPRRLGKDLVIIDESHRFRNPAARRYLHLAPALVGKRGLLLSATPVVNALEDLAHQLLLLVRDDALATAGIPSLSRAIPDGGATQALPQLIVAGSAEAGKPIAVEWTSPASDEEDRSARRVLRRLAGLNLSPSRAVRQLVLGVFSQALASSPAALRTTLVRYRHLLLQAQDAARSGHPLARSALRRALCGDAAQLVLWELLDPAPGEADLDVGDLPELGRILPELERMARRGDGKVERLQRILDGRSTVVFASARATVHHLRGQLGPASRIAWCTGDQAGIGPARLPREQVLGWFRPGTPDTTGLGPRILITTDVASEGLDLQRAERVVHYDLPWTAVRLRQRAGRAIRLGSRHRSVEVVTFLPPPVLERRLGVGGAIVRKRRLEEEAGLSERLRALARRRAELASRAGAGSRQEHVGEAIGSRHLALAAIRLSRGGDPLETFVLVQRRDGTWSADQAEVVSAVEDALRGAVVAPFEPARAASVLRQLERLMRRMVRRAEAGTRHPGSLTPAECAGMRRIRAFAAAAVRARDPRAIDAAERGLAFVGRGHTAGERHLIGQLACLADQALIERLLTVPAPASPDPLPIRATLAGVILFREP